MRRIRVCLLALLTVTVPTAHADKRPAIDAASVAPASAAAARLASLARDPHLARIATTSSTDERFGVPTFLWAARPATTPGQPDLRSAARAHLAQLAGFYGLSDADVRDLTLTGWHDTGRGAVIGTFKQSVDGIEVFRDELKVNLDRQGRLVSASGFVPPAALAGARAGRAFRLSAAAAAQVAVDDLAGASAGVRPAGPADAGANGGYDLFELDAAGAEAALHLYHPIRVKPVFFHLPESLVPGYYVEVLDSDAPYAYVVSAADGTLLYRQSLTQDAAYTYRVWADVTGERVPLDGPQGSAHSPHPTGLPDFSVPSFVPSVLLNLQNGPISTNDPWLAPGATQTLGNNVDAYADLVAPSGFSAGDLRGATSSPGAFDYLYDLNLDPDANTTQQMASITQVFYLTNFMHDWFYDSGFDEAAGNGQTDNYGRGGFGGDAMLVETHDYISLGEASMSTAADGAPARMQTSNWLTPDIAIQALTPPSLAGGYQAGLATFGPQAFDLTAPIARASNSTFAVIGSSTLAVGSGPQWVTIGDLNGDTHPDLATANYGTANVSVMLSNGAGGFLPRTDHAASAGPFTVEPASLDGNASRDLVVANTLTGTVSVLLGTGGGGFGPKTDFAAGAGCAAARVGRINADAQDDVVTVNYSAHTVSVLLGNGSGGLAPQVTFPAGLNPNWVEIGDLNGDGANDLAVANAGAGTVSVLLGNGAGSFGPKTDYACGAGPLTVALGNLDGDDDLDAVTANFSANTVAVLLGNGSGGFGAPTAYATAAAPVTVRLGDLNADGLLDLAVCSDASNVVSWRFGNGNGGFGARVDQAVGTTPYAVAIGDVNGDGEVDLLSANYSSSDVTILAGNATFSSDACATLVNDLTGKIALIDRGGCLLVGKAQRAQAAGAVGVIVADDVVSQSPPALGGSGAVSIPSLGVTLGFGNAIKSALASGPASLRMMRGPGLEHDAALDNQITGHEWGHFLANRLAGPFTSNMSGGLNEGWGDFVAMMLTVRPGDDVDGVFPIMSYALQPHTGIANEYYFGVRRLPYSTQFSKNALTFQHIQLGVPLPVGPPTKCCADGTSNPTVHSTGEVWCTMLWECYAALLHDNGRLTFAEAQARMKAYLVAGLKLTPTDPTFTEARDAMLAAAAAADGTDLVRFWHAFAKRGIGVGAVSPPRFSDTNTGVVESYSTAGAAAITEPAPTELNFSLAGRHPARGGVEFRFDLPAADRVTITIHDLTGRLVATLVDADLAAGRSTARWIRAPGGTPPGVYFARMRVAGKSMTRRVVVIE